MHKLWFHKNDDITLKFLADEILADCSQNRQSAKINSPPKFPAIRYLQPVYVTSRDSYIYSICHLATVSALKVYSISSSEDEFEAEETYSEFIGVDYY